MTKLVGISLIAFSNSKVIRSSGESGSKLVFLQSTIRSFSMASQEVVFKREGVLDKEILSLLSFLFLAMDYLSRLIEAAEVKGLIKKTVFGGGSFLINIRLKPRVIFPPSRIRGMVSG